ncbi:MAG TPA: hypothetical protein ENI62_11715 [Gammaproteobacteria bacterium]|mgnify:CR=1 FL=1|nr:hypothetical protein [Gammaproteobacteria bacterium]
MNHFQALMIAAAVSGSLSGQAQASIVFSHSGNTDPTTEGWAVEPVAFFLDQRPTATPVSNDQGSGLNAWSIDDNSTFIGTNWFYTQSPSTAETTQANTLGWALRANLRIVDTPDAVGNAGSIILEYANGTTAYRLALGSEADGDPMALLWDGGVDPNNTLAATGTLFTLQNGGAGYHLYEMVYDPLVDSVDLFIDGVERISNYAGVSSSLFNRVAWGSASSSDTGQSNWNQVEFEIAAVPLPAALPLFFSGLLGLGWIGKSRRHSAPQKR